MKLLVKRNIRITHGLKNKEAAAGFLFIFPSIAGFAFFYFIPFIIGCYYSFVSNAGSMQFVGLKNFIDLFGSDSFLRALKNTFRFNGISVPLIMLVALAFALLLNRKIKGIVYFRMFFVLPLVVPVASIILVWQVFFNEFGVLNHLLKSLGTDPIEWMRTGWSVGVLMLLYIWKNCGYNVILFLGGLSNIPEEYYESARIDGANSFTCFIRITLPFIMPVGFFVFIISIINSFKVFREAYLLAGSYPQLDIYMLQHFMNNNFFNLSLQRLSTAAVLFTALITLLVLVLFKMESRFSKNIV